jgi:hypothetical protein
MTVIANWPLRKDVSHDQELDCKLLENEVVLERK